MEYLAYIVLALIVIKVPLNMRLGSRYQQFYAEDIVQKGGRPSFKAIDLALAQNANDAVLCKDLKSYRRLLLVSFWLSIVIFVLVIMVVIENMEL